MPHQGSDARATCDGTHAERLTIASLAPPGAPPRVFDLWRPGIVIEGMGDWGLSALSRRVRNPTEWSIAKKCALVLAIFLAFDLWEFVAGVHFARHPDQAPYLDQAVLAVETWLLGIESVLATALLAWALITRRWTLPIHPLLSYGTAVLCGVNVLQGAYIYGTHTRLYTAAAICGCVAVGTVLFDRRVVRLWLWTVMTIVSAITLGEIAEIIPYAPLLARMPMGREHMALSWLLGGGGISFAMFYVAVVLTYRVVRSWQDRGERLLEAAKQLGVAERLRTIINAIDDGIVVLDADRRVVSANDAFLRRAGSVAEKVVGRPCNDVNPSLGCANECPARSCLVHGDRRSQVYGRPLPGGDTAWEEVRASPILDDAGNVVRIVEVWRDISERRRAEVRMAESHRLTSLGMLASGFSHELNTPLHTVLACVEGILRTAEGGRADGWQQVGKHAQIARDQLLRCRSTIQHFLRLASGKGAPAEVIEVGAAVHEVARLSEPTAKARGVGIRIDSAVEGVRVRGNGADLQHILLNLILNAIEASPPGGEVRLTVAGHDPVRIRVSDDGRGIAPADQARIFEPFCSLRPDGIGLGLFLSLTFAQRWGADIRVTSGPGAGSTFEVMWPAIALGSGMAAPGAAEMHP